MSTENREIRQNLANTEAIIDTTKDCQDSYLNEIDLNQWNSNLWNN
ncbi:MAG: hypothetical protein ACXABO_00880 [Promethearchaeota archaeon]|jgi:hypothetical protein